jgi:hypothetical protein
MSSLPSALPSPFLFVRRYCLVAMVCQNFLPFRVVPQYVRPSDFRRQPEIERRFARILDRFGNTQRSQLE